MKAVFMSLSAVLCFGHLPAEEDDQASPVIGWQERARLMAEEAQQRRDEEAMAHLHKLCTDEEAQRHFREVELPQLRKKYGVYKAAPEPEKEDHQEPAIDESDEAPDLWRDCKLERLAIENYITKAKQVDPSDTRRSDHTSRDLQQLQIDREDEDLAAEAESDRIASEIDALHRKIADMERSAERRAEDIEIRRARNLEDELYREHARIIAEHDARRRLDDIAYEIERQNEVMRQIEMQRIIEEQNRSLDRISRDLPR